MNTKFSFKFVKNLLYLTIFFLVLLPLSLANAQQRGGTPTTTTGLTMKGGDSLTTTGFSGIINVASAKVIDNGIAAAVTFSVNSRVAMLPRVGIGFLNCLEIAGGVDLPFSNMKYTGGNVGLKWKFWSNEAVALALSGNFQFNKATATDLHLDYQVLFHSTWSINNSFTTTAVLGTTFGDSGHNFRSWDFGLGFLWWFFNNTGFSMGLAVDYTNYDYRVLLHYIPASGSWARGNVSSVIRFAFLNKLLMLDLGASNLVNKHIAFYGSIGTSFSF